jgi:hypothetical protein
MSILKATFGGVVVLAIFKTPNLQAHNYRDVK